MKTKLHKLAVILFLFITFYSTAQDIEGSWNGVLKIQGQELPIVFNISINDDILNTTMDSPSQGAVGIATDSTSFVDNILLYFHSNYRILP